MKGKIVNLLMGLLNLMVGIVIIFYTVYIPTDLIELTVQENEVVDVLKIAIYVILGVTSFLNLLGFHNNKTNDGLRFGYKIFLFTLSFIFIKQPLIAAFAIISAIIIVKNIIKENLREIESTLAISVIIVMIVATLILDLSIYFYKYLGNYILEKKNENQIEYSDAYFKYITELEDTEPYLNVKKEDKYGYINLKGETVIDFEYDFASPFTIINVYDKNFEVALVCKDGISQIIMKNKRVVKSYVSESSDENYEAKMNELKDFYENTIGMEDEMVFEIDINNKINKAESYYDESEEYTYRYDYNEEYDVLVTKSSMGLGDTYVLAKKDDLDYQLELDCEHLDYDEDYLYLYRDGTIPFYNPDKNEQGWFSARGVKKSMKGNAQILEKLGDVFLYKNYNDDGQIVFVNQNGEKLSEAYKEIYIQDDRYIVKKMNDKFTIINSEYKPIIDQEYDYVDVSLAEYGVYLVGNFSDEIISFNEFEYADLNFSLLDYDGNVINENIEQIYSNFYELGNEENKIYVSRYNEFTKKLQSMNNKFVGDKFYKK